MSFFSTRSKPLELWPTYLFHSECKLKPMIEKWKKECKLLLPDEETIRSYRNNRPWCSESDELFNIPNFSNLTEWILNETKNGLDYMGVVRDSHYVSSLWLNAQYESNNHTLHSHSNSILSGVVYIDIPPNSQKIVFKDPRPQSQVLVPIQRDTGEFPINPVEGAMFFWPSWLEHKTVTNSFDTLERPRLTLAFNIMIKHNIKIHGGRFNFV